MNEQKGIVITRKTIVIAAVIFLLLLAGGVAIGLNLADRNGGSGETQGGAIQAAAQTADSEKPKIVIDENAGEYTGELPKEQNSSEAVGIKIPGYPSITIAKDTQDVKMALLNPEGNPCYFKFEIALKDSGETIFESQYVKPGSCIYDVHLNKTLAAGEHPAVIKISTISLDGETPLNGANVETVLIAK